MTVFSFGFFLCFLLASSTVFADANDVAENQLAGMYRYNILL